MNTKTTPRDFFLHLGAIVALIVSVVSIINLYFSVINYYFPDQLAGYFYVQDIAWPISVLIVLLPLLFVLEYFIEKDIKINIEKAELWIRKWRVYLTLFITGATIVGDIIALINVYLSGEISERFLYKILVVIVISGIVFTHFLFSKNVPVIGSKSHKVKKVIPWLAVVVGILAVVLGFMVAGSPTKQRDLKLDSQTINDLSNIQWQLINYWQLKGTLPKTLDELNDSISGYFVAVDPKTEQPYGYNHSLVNNKHSFELCANFARESEDNKGRGEFGVGYSKGIATDAMYSVGYSDGYDNWKHSKGLSCFTRTIDPDKYPVNEK